MTVAGVSLWPQVSQGIPGKLYPQQTIAWSGSDNAMDKSEESVRFHSNTLYSIKQVQKIIFWVVWHPFGFFSHLLPSIQCFLFFITLMLLVWGADIKTWPTDFIHCAVRCGWASAKACDLEKAHKLLQKIQTWMHARCLCLHVGSPSLGSPM